MSLFDTGFVPWRIASFSVQGIPQSQGSKTAFVVNGRAVMREGRTDEARDRFRSWRAVVADAAAEQRFDGETGPFDGPVALILRFAFPRPKQHISAKGEVKSRYANAQVTRKPDIDKLARAVLDALTGVVFTDDSQVVQLTVTKRYDQTPGLDARIFYGATSEQPAA